MTGLLEITPAGLYCPVGDFHIDPWRGVDFALVTHAHSDHARRGSRRYVTSAPGRDVLRVRLGERAEIHSLPYGQQLTRNGVRVSLHPAGHVLGSAQVRIEWRGEVAVVSGDYKLECDSVCAPFEPQRCHTFITESTFGLPIYRWPPQADVFAAINAWWSANQRAGRTSVLLAYALGKAQRLIANVDPSIGPILAHRTIMELLPAHEAAGVRLPPVRTADCESVGSARGRALVVAPSPGSIGRGRFGPARLARVSGWEQQPAARRPAGVDDGFALSDHADWEGLLSAIRATGAENIGVMHGYAVPLARWLNEHGWNAFTLGGRFGRDSEEDAAACASWPAGTA